MGDTPALLIGRGRVALLAALGALFTAWSAGAGLLPAATAGFDVALVACLILPTAFAAVWLALPLAASARLRQALSGAAAAGLLWLLGANALADSAKLAALALAGFWLLTLFDAAWWVALVAVIVPWTDILSVYRGPTKVVLEQRPGLFEAISVGFRLPGEEAGARIGPPDVLFFALFLAAAQRFGLRVRATWCAMCALLGLTLVATYVYELGGLPALPALALGFLLPNADRLLASARR